MRVSVTKLGVSIQKQGVILAVMKFGEPELSPHFFELSSEELKIFWKLVSLIRDNY